jgi:hypothetical protein
MDLISTGMVAAAVGRQLDRVAEARVVGTC